MAQNKKNHFEQTDVILAGFAKALAHPARIAILKTLAAKKSCICGEIVEVIPLAQATVSQHLKELKNAGLIKGEIDGAKSCYCINYETLNKIASQFSEMMENLKNTPNTECC